MYKKRTFRLIPLILVIFAFECSPNQIDSYATAPRWHSQEYTTKSSKWSKNNQNSDMCGGIFRSKQVTIKSPHYPNTYPKNVHCEYIFYSPFVCNNEFHIQFLDFQLEPSLSCAKDKLMIASNEYCGQVIGIMKYRTTNGTLRINFITDQTIENKGFHFVVTRLPCSLNNSSVSKKEINGYLTTSPPIQAQSLERNLRPEIPQVVNALPEPNFEHEAETSIVKADCQNPNAIAKSNIHPHNFPRTAEPPSLPSCCINIFNQKQFYLISPGFPNAPQFHSDCLYFIERFHPNICRLRIDFRYFLLDDWQQNQCKYNFLEIDGQRFCGCNTGFTYYTQLGFSPKAIRFANSPKNQGTQGFVLEITQEECPYWASPFQQTNQLKTKDHHMIPNACLRRSFSYISWLNLNSNRNLLAKSICIRNIGWMNKISIVSNHVF